MSIEVAAWRSVRRLRRARRRRPVASRAGELTALLGPSGGGKSTLLRIIAGLEEPDSGIVKIEGVDATRLPAQRRNVGFVFQHYAAFKHLSVYRNVAFGLEIRKRPQGRDPQAGGRAARAGAPRASSPTGCRRSCPAASASGWRWPARWPSSRRCCCSTSRSAPWTPRCARNCATGCAACTTRCT